MLSYGGHEVIVASNELAEWLSNIPPSSAYEFPRWKTFTQNFSPFNHLATFLDVPIRVNCYYNPWSASRWGHCFILVDDDTLQSLRNLAYASNVYTPLTLEFDDEDGETVSTDLWMLAPVPLTKFDLTDPTLQAVTNDMYLVTLVDDRYFWYERTSSIGGFSTWAQLYAKIALALGITLTVDTIPAAYLTPGAEYIQYQEYLPLMLDWVAVTVGHRIIRNLDGTFRAISAETSLAIVADFVASRYAKKAGGGMAFGVANDE